jgi:CheY-like chemotaxis protein
MQTVMGRPILLIEDHRVDITNVRRAFERCELTNPLLVARTGEEAFYFLRGHEGQPRAPTPGLILLDLNMPVMNGSEFLAEIRNDPRLQTIPVVVLTTSGEACDRDTAFRYGAAGYFIKPLSFADFVELIRTIALYWELSEQP